MTNNDLKSIFLKRSLVFLWFQESHYEVGPAARGSSAHSLNVRGDRPAAGAQQHRRLDRESLLKLACCCIVVERPDFENF